jgi:transcriptional regulator GlxA family with amidase domain
MNFGFLAFPKLEELDLIGPWEMVGMWGQSFGGPKNRLIVAQTDEPIPCAKGLLLNPHVSFAECPPLDFLLVPGGEGTRKEENNPFLIRFIAEQAKFCKAVLSVCTGAFLLHKAGLLSGKRATTHWNSLARLKELGDLTVVEERIVRDGHIWSSAGVSAGIDLSLALIAEMAGEETAARVQLGSEYYPSGRRYGTLHKGPMAPAYLKKV